MNAFPEKKIGYNISCIAFPAIMPAQNTNEGKTAYKGTENRFTDKKVVQDRQYYYQVFAKK